MSEGRSFRSSLKWAVVMNWGQRGISILFTILLAAILGPSDFGVVAMALVYVMLIEVFLEQGLSTAIIQRKELAPEHLDAAFWLNLAWGVVLAGVGVATAGLWARVTDTPKLEPVIQVLSITLVLMALTIVQQAILQRELEFKKLALRANVAALAGGACGLALALVGAGVWALVAQQLTTQTVSLILLWSISQWVPRLRFSWKHATDLLGFSADVFVANLGGFLSRRADTFLIGIFFSPAVVGIYRLADRFIDVLLELTMRPVAAISLPHFSRQQDDIVELRGTVGRCIRIALYTTVPTLLVVAACSEHVLAVVGTEWVVGATALKLLAVVGIIKGFVFFAGPLLFAVARPRLRAIVLWSLALVSAGMVVAAGVVFEDASDTDQLLGMSSARALTFLIAFLPVNLFIICRISGLKLRSILPWLPAPFGSGAAALCVGAVLDASSLLHGMAPVPALVVAAAPTITAATVTFLALDADLRHQLSALLRRRLRRRASAGAHVP
jgi:PST family polysaccharide transporter